MNTPVKAFSLDALEHGVSRGRPRVVGKKSVTFHLSPAGVAALAAIEAAYARAGIAAFSRHTVIERMLIDGVAEAERLAANVAKYLTK